jgi:hypothetical protein
MTVISATAPDFCFTLWVSDKIYNASVSGIVRL